MGLGVAGVVPFIQLDRRAQAPGRRVLVPVAVPFFGVTRCFALRLLVCGFSSDARGLGLPVGGIRSVTGGRAGRMGSVGVAVRTVMAVRAVVMAVMRPVAAVVPTVMMRGVPAAHDPFPLCCPSDC
ncbi:MAG: hypothetical protein VKO64_03190 [Candidatus Sericytochromatia bacterium]|nr:hypothetical protein [Candidatus Sericytochromatia bacterium]